MKNIIRYQLKDVAYIYTVEKNIVDNKFLFVYKSISSFSINFPILKDFPQRQGFCVVAQNVNYLNIEYISFWVNSVIGKVSMFVKDNGITYKKHITNRALGLCPIYIVPIPFMKSLTALQHIVDFTNMSMKKRQNDRYVKLQYSLFSEIRDGISIEITLESLMYGRTFGILDEWLELWNMHGEKEQSSSQIFNELISDNCTILNKIKKCI